MRAKRAFLLHPIVTNYQGETNTFELFEEINRTKFVLCKEDYWNVAEGELSERNVEQKTSRRFFVEN